MIAGLILFLGLTTYTEYASQNVELDTVPLCRPLIAQLKGLRAKYRAHTLFNPVANSAVFLERDSDFRNSKRSGRKDISSWDHLEYYFVPKDSKSGTVYLAMGTLKSIDLYRSEEERWNRSSDYKRWETPVSWKKVIPIGTVELVNEAPAGVRPFMHYIQGSKRIRVYNPILKGLFVETSEAKGIDGWNLIHHHKFWLIVNRALEELNKRASQKPPPN